MAARLTLKNSSVQFRNATASQLGVGELALNYHESGPYLQCKDSSGAIIQIGGIYVAAIAPLNPIKGKQWLNTTNDRLYVYSGSAWVGTQVVNVAGDLPEASAMTTADLNLDEPSTRLLPDSAGLATQKDLNVWIGDALNSIDGRVLAVEQDYTTSDEFTEISLQVAQNKKDIKALQDQVNLLSSLVPPVDYGTVTIEGGNDYQNGQCLMSPDETSIFICSLDGSQTTGCRYNWQIMRGEGRFSGSATTQTVSFTCQSAALTTVILRCTVSHPTTEEAAYADITIVVQSAN